MLNRIFWAVTITIPLYLSIAIETSSRQDKIGFQTIEQPSYVISYFKKRLNHFQQELREAPTSSVKTKLNQ